MTNEEKWEKHDCLRSSKVIKCDEKTDKHQCIVCKREWTEPCNFDEDYS